MKKVVVIGAGFVGINCIQKLSKYNGQFEVTLLDKSNHHVFQPMLYQAATAFIPLNSVVAPIRKVLHNKPNVKFKMGEVIDICPSKQIVKTSKNFYKYDYLVVAPGVEYDYLGNDGWKNYTLSLKTAYDAEKIKSHIIKQFELAESSNSKIDTFKHLTFIIIGAGATGVEITGALLDILSTDIFDTYSNFSIEDININLVDSGNKILSAFPKKLSDHAYSSLVKRGVKIHLNETVINISEHCVQTDKSIYQGATIIWSTVLKGKPLGLWMEKQMSKGKVNVLPDLTHGKHDNIYFGGDISRCKDNPLPGLASVAKQQGKYIANHIVNRNKTKRYKNFKYKDLGTMAIIQKHSAIARIFGLNLTGKLGWFIWGGVHITFLVSIRNKFVVSFNWLSYYLFNRIGSPEILEPDKERDHKLNVSKPKT
ncbi:NAD(P)/FAD-dependent oxidoreductase [Allofrancisella guangzhouensis]|uniref:NADH:ubiquinone reductase (non-electrogenic) n=1 Tax=Allofrancisella guangzhouensis TaxID=594679 RepID=A0A0A8E617_9GAMM|nr:NAD(P)/FAD-dependent oxidoreductase [Allofrancisella guangzhouensis]AJC49458.1 NADH dehydrogenase [Allofrancisella guangzhouensis]MBK2026753.1 NAD(P)/FAD-dependent oxidoreductase [Allofrancisella guangzhouensis]MBK2044258.1 NAD(P)/FAD-dependent oxidoreductase [Allofrancisella guangzhouensis]MBK2046167.1 NAD(P)/FAD-dependent oxidoreductase [Allofrancisella guangzhouensis]